MLSRILAFGFISTLYRVATVKPRLIGTFTAGFLVLSALSLPVLALASWMVHWLFFGETLAMHVFAIVVVAEALLWRPVELAIIVNNGLGRFGKGSLLAIIGTAARAAAAVLFTLQGSPSLAEWSLYYRGANAAVAAIAFTSFYPRQRLAVRAAALLAAAGRFHLCRGRGSAFLPADGVRQVRRAADRGRRSGRHLRRHHAAGRSDRHTDPHLHDDAGAADDAHAGDAVQPEAARRHRACDIRRFHRGPLLSRAGALFLPQCAWPKHRRGGRTHHSGAHNPRNTQSRRIPGRASLRPRPDTAPRDQSGGAGGRQGGAARRRAST